VLAAVICCVTVISLLKLKNGFDETKGLRVTEHLHFLMIILRSRYKIQGGAE